MSDLELAREWLSATPYLSYHPGEPPNLPITIATEERIASLAALMERVRREERERCGQIVSKGMAAVAQAIVDEMSTESEGAR